MGSHIHKVSSGINEESSPLGNITNACLGHQSRPSATKEIELYKRLNIC
jgi:hypothetical protein